MVGKFFVSGVPKVYSARASHVRLPKRTHVPHTHTAPHKKTQCQIAVTQRDISTTLGAPLTSTSIFSSSFFFSLAPSESSVWQQPTFGCNSWRL